MKFLLWLFVALVLLLGVGFAWLWFGTAGPLPEVTFAEATELQRMIGFAPEDEDELFVIPAVGPLYGALRSSDVTSAGVRDMPRAREVEIFSRLLGRAPAVAWTRSGDLFMVAKPPALRAAFIGLAARIAGVSVPVVRRGDYLLIGSVPGSEAPLTIASSLADAKGHFFVFHRGGKSRYPPLERPAISAVTIARKEITISSAAALPAASSQALTPAAGVVFSMPDDAIGAALLTARADVVRDLDRFLPFDFSRLASQGAMLVIYDLETGKLLPRPRGFLAMPSTPGAVDAVSSLFNVAAVPRSEAGVTNRSVGPVQIDRIERFGAVLETARFGGEVLLGFDGASIERYLNGSKSDLTAEPGVMWRFEADAAKLRPVVADLADDRTLKYAAGRISRSAKQLNSVLRLFAGAAWVSAQKRHEGNREIVQLTISAAK